MSLARKMTSPDPNIPSTSDGMSFRALYEKYQGIVRSVIFRIAGPQELDDLVQETFIRVWQSLSKFRGRSSLKTWVYRIATNLAYDYCRKNKKRKQEVE